MKIKINKPSTKPTSNKDTVEEAYLHYVKNRDIKLFMECCSSYIITFIRRNLNRDEDISYDFFLYFYENAEKFIEKYESKKTSPISAFLSRYLKNEYMNYIRKKRNRDFVEITGMDNVLSNIPVDSSGSIHDRIKIESLLQELILLPPDKRIPLKMYYGLDLNLKELDYLAGQIGPARTVKILKSYRIKKEKLHSRQVSLCQRAARLNFMIHRGEGGELKTRRWFFLKKQVEECLHRMAPVTSLQELSEIFGINKSSMARKLKRTQMELVRQEHKVLKNYEGIL